MFGVIISFLFRLVNAAEKNADDALVLADVIKALDNVKHVDQLLGQYFESNEGKRVREERMGKDDATDAGIIQAFHNTVVTNLHEVSTLSNDDLLTAGTAAVKQFLDSESFKAAKAAVANSTPRPKTRLPRH